MGIEDLGLCGLGASATSACCSIQESSTNRASIEHQSSLRKIFLFFLREFAFYLSPLTLVPEMLYSSWFHDSKIG